MRLKDYLILTGILIIGVIITIILSTGDEFFILIGVVFGIIMLLTLIATTLEELFPKNKFSKKLEKIAEWIQDNVHF